MKWQAKRRLYSEQGSNVAQAAAVALLAVALLGAMLLIVPSFRASVSQSFACLVGAIGGGGGACGGSAQTTATIQPAAPPQQEQEEECGGLCQVGGFFKGIGEGVVDTATGLWTLGSDAVKYAAGDDETRQKYAALVESFQNDPWGTTKAVGEAIVEPIVTDWQEGRYGEAIGRGVFEVVSTIGGPKGVDKVGKLGKVDDIARVAGTADEIADVGRTADRLGDLGDIGRQVDDIPCVGAAPAGKLPGLAAPLAGACSFGRPGGFATRAEFDAATRGTFSTAEEADVAWKVYQQNLTTDATPVIGRQVDTAVAGEWSDHTILNTPGWTLNVNDAWIQAGIDRGARFYLGSPLNDATLKHPIYGETVFKRELDQLIAAGYRQQGDYMIPPP